MKTNYAVRLIFIFVCRGTLVVCSAITLSRILRYSQAIVEVTIFSMANQFMFFANACLGVETWMYAFAEREKELQ